MNIALQVAERGARQVYTSGWGVGTRPPQCPGRPWQPYRRRVLLLGRPGGCPYPGRTKQKNHTPLSNPAGVLPTPPGGWCRPPVALRSDESEAAEASQTSWQEGQARLGGSLQGRRHTVNPCLTDCKRSAVRRVTVRGRVPGARVRVGVCQRPPALALGCMADYYCVVISSSHLSLVGSRHTWRVLMTTGRPHGQGKVVSPPKVLLAVQAWPSDPKHSLVVWVT